MNVKSIEELPVENRLPDALPCLTAMGQELNTSAEAFGELASANHLIEDPVALRQKMRQDGYLYLPDYLNRDEVLDARDEIAAILEEQGALNPQYSRSELIAGQGGVVRTNPEIAYKSRALNRVLYGGAMMRFYARFFGETVLHYDYTWLRTVMPGTATPPHMDVVYMGRGTHNLLTAWTPLNDIPIVVGGLIILEHSHLHERINSNYGRRDVDSYCTNDHSERQEGAGSNVQSHGWLSRNPVKLRERLGGRWLTAQYRAGDLLTFTMNTIHASLDNNSRLIRLSSDSRYQPASEAVDERWIGENPIAHGPNAKRGMIC
jgi:hypothetical protein